MKKRRLSLLFTLSLSLLFLSACVPDLKIHFKKVPTTSSSSKNSKKVAQVDLAIRVIQVVQTIHLALLQQIQIPLLNSSQPKGSLEMPKKLPRIKFMQLGT